jgi:hypothetical protein
MKKKLNPQVATFIIFALLVAVVYLLMYPKETVVQVPVPVEMNAPREVIMEPEFRNPPIKKYKPGHVQQMGVLIGDNNETLPLYGKEVRGRRDRYHYYTATSGDQIYPLPVSMGDRDCMDDIGCQEIYGNESVSVMGNDSNFQAKLYRTDDFF